MDVRIQGPKTITTSVSLPSSKSESNRALIIQFLSKSDFPIHNLSEAEDTQTLLKILSGLKENDSQTIDVGPAGTCMRFLTAALSITKGSWTLTGSERMKERPLGTLINALQSLGADIQYLEKENYPPILIRGKPLSGKSLTIKGNESSQFITALILIAPLLPDGLEITLEGQISSRPYLDMSLQMLQHFGVKSNFEENHILIRPQKYQDLPFSIEGDWSAASYWYEIAAFSKDCDIQLKGLRRTSLQGDAVLPDIYKALGVKTDFNDDGIRLTKTPIIASSFEYDFTKCPDLAQTLAATCVGLGIKATLKGLHTLKIKETDRIEALVNELGKTGSNITSNNKDSIFIPEINNLNNRGLEFKTYHDHRMAMCLAPLGMVLEEVQIENPVVIGKSYPSFWNHLTAAGFHIQPAL